MSDRITNQSLFERWQWASRHWAWLAVGLTLLLVVAVRVPLREMPLERDEGEYAYMGQLILQGVPPYKEACNMKLPGTYAAYALSMACFGQTAAGIHLGVMMVNAASIVLMFLLGRKLLDEIAGVVAALSYGLLSLSPSVVGLAGHATHFVVLPALGGTLVLLRAIGRVPKSDPAHGPALFAAGLLFGLAFLMKQHGIFFGIFGALYLIGSWIGRCYAARVAATVTGMGLTEMKTRRRAGWRKWRLGDAKQQRPRPSGVRPPTPGAQPASPPQRLSHFAAAKRKPTEPEKREEQIRNPKSEIRNKSEKSEISKLEIEEGENLVASSERPRPDAATHSPAHPLTHSPAPSPTHSPTPPPTPFPDTPLLVAPRLSTLVVELAVYGAGLVLPYLITCLVLWQAGVFKEFVFWTISYARNYAGIMSGSQGLDMFRAMLSVAVGYNFLLWLLPWAGALVMWWDPRLTVNRRFLLTTFLLCSAGSVSVGLYFRLHYFITLLPALALLSGVGVSRALFALRTERTLELFVAVPVLVLVVLAIGAALIGNGPIWFAMSPEQAGHEVHGTSLYTEALKVADYLKANTTKDARLAVIGSEPEIFFYARRRSATKYLYVYPLMEPQAFARQMQEEMIKEIEQGRPEYILYADDWTSWLRRPESNPKLDEWWQRFWPLNYNLVKTVSVDSWLTQEELPGMKNQEEEHRSPIHTQLMLFKRK